MVYRPFPAFDEWGGDFDSSLVDRYFRLLKAARDTATPEKLQAALMVAMRSAAVDTGAIEGLYTTDRGFTKTVATQALAWELKADEKGPHVRRAIEDALAGYEMVLDAVTGSQVPVITETWIRQLHQTMLASQKTHRAWVDALNGFQDQPLPLGQYKEQPNSPITPSETTHDYAPPSDTGAEMARLMDELRSPSFAGAHPIVQAAYAHYAFVCIHPLVDGNGRVARALSSVFLYRNPGVPLVVFMDKRDEYLDALEAADGGDPLPFIRFISDCVMDTVNLVRASLSSVDVSDSIASITSKLDTDIDETTRLSAERLFQACSRHLTDAISHLMVHPNLKIHISHSGIVSTSVPPEGYFFPDLGSGSVGLSATTGSARAGLAWQFHSIAATMDASKPTFLVIPSDGSEPLEVRRGQVEPIIATSLVELLTTWADNAVARYIIEISRMIADGSLTGEGDPCDVESHKDQEESDKLP